MHHPVTQAAHQRDPKMEPHYILKMPSGEVPFISMIKVPNAEILDTAHSREEAEGMLAYYEGVYSEEDHEGFWTKMTVVAGVALLIFLIMDLVV